MIILSCIFLLYSNNVDFILGVITATVGSLILNKYYQQLKIPTFVKMTKVLRKLIEDNSKISETLVYPPKKDVTNKLLRDQWEAIGLSPNDILKILGKKIKKAPEDYNKLIKVEGCRNEIPIGIVIMKWDEIVGNEIVVKYPEEINITDNTLMQIYNTHEYSGESGMVSFTGGTLNIASYYTGQDKRIYILLLLTLDDDPDAYEICLTDLSRVIILDVDNNVIKDTIASLFRRLSEYPTLNDDQQLYNIYQNEIKRMIITRLRDEGVVSKSELMVWLKDKYKSGFLDLDGILIDLIKRDIVKETSVKEIPSVLIFLTNDIIMFRVPPIRLLKIPEKRGIPLELLSDYQKEVKDYFQGYHPSDKDNLKLIELLNDPEVYEVFRLLKKEIVIKNDLKTLKKKGVVDINSILKKLWDNQLIQLLQDKQNNEYYALLCDFYINLIFPTYLTRVIKSEYEKKSKSNLVLMEYLKILEDAYVVRKSEKKKKKKNQ